MYIAVTFARWIFIVFKVKNDKKKQKQKQTKKYDVKMR